jgi:photosystem II stability/assembly factor-like uncharacterized protein
MRFLISIRMMAAALTAVATLTAAGAFADDAPSPWGGLELRTIGPAVTSGRVSDFAVHPQHKHHYFVATASGGLWLTKNDGITWTPVFDNYASYSIADVEVDPSNPMVVWVGTGENNSQRSVAYGDGVYRSVDGGRTFTNVGLKQSEHIGQIGFDPTDSSIVYVAAQGPLWSAGGDRGLYRTRDGGASWEQLLAGDEYTGANEFVIHPDNPDHIVVSTYQRHRAIWTLINGGPGSAIHKSTDGGKTWRKLAGGLPGKGDLGRIGLAGAPSAPNVIYAIIESATEGESGVYRSSDFGESWEKRSGFETTSAQYYNELFVDPQDADRVYAVDTFTSVSEDGGKSFTRLSFEDKHVDDHAVWIDPDNTEHLRIGGDGGVYESWDRGHTWRHMQNLPLTQFYRATPDNGFPFYSVYGGTQDNNTLGAPTRTTSEKGITNADWTFTLGGDGFKPQIDPTDPSIIYSQYQYGGLARFDMNTGERVYITPQPASGETALRWNWNSPLIISPHDPKRLYYGAEKLFRSDDRGNSWRAVSGNLTRQLDRNELEVMGRIWSVDSVAKNSSTSVYGSLVALDESPLVEGLLFAGTDDGLIQISENGGGQWHTVSDIIGVPSMSLVEDIIASHHDADTAYAVFDNHKRGDFKPYVFRSRDRGRSWKNITGDLPERGTAHTIIEDHVDPDLLFVGTEFGLFVTQDGGLNWTELKGGFPTIAVRDLEIQRRESDLVVATFGRGIYILDDYSPLRTKTATLMAEDATLFPVKDAWAYFPRDFGPSAGKALYAAPNPAFGAVFTYHLKDGFKTLAEERREAERKLEKSGADTPYPGWDALRAEDREEAPSLSLTVTDASGAIVRRLSASAAKGLHRVAWDLRLPAPDPVQLTADPNRPPWRSAPSGPMVAPGEYTVAMSVRHRGEVTALGAPKTFTVKALEQGGIVAADRNAVVAFEQKTARLKRAVDGSLRYLGEMQSRVAHLKKGLMDTPAETGVAQDRVREIEAAMADLSVAMTGDRTISRRQEPVPWSIAQRVSSIVYGHWDSQAPVTDTHKRAYDIAAGEFEQALAELKRIDRMLGALEARAERLRAPYTPGRLPDWQPE